MSASEPGTQVGVLRRTGELGRLVRLWAEAAQAFEPVVMVGSDLACQREVRIKVEVRDGDNYHLGAAVLGFEVTDGAALVARVTDGLDLTGLVRVRQRRARPEGCDERAPGEAGAIQPVEVRPR